MTSILRKRLRITVSNKKNTYRVKVKSRKRNKKAGQYAVVVSILALLVFVAIIVIVNAGTREAVREKADRMLPQLNIKEQLLDVNEYSRPGIALNKVKGIVVHYTANQGTDAEANRNYFNHLPAINEKKQQKTYASSHFVIGLNGQIIQCIPLNEIAYASNERNSDTISIECCHKTKSGKFTDETYQSLVRLTTYLCMKYNLEADDVIRHYDVTGKNCPKYFVEHKAAWAKFLKEVTTEINRLKNL